jgi:hypothetical protein
MAKQVGQGADKFDTLLSAAQRRGPETDAHGSQVTPGLYPWNAPGSALQGSHPGNAAPFGSPAPSLGSASSTVAPATPAAHGSQANTVTAHSSAPAADHQPSEQKKVLA